MVNVKSQRAMALIKEPRFFKNIRSEKMRHYPGESLDLWAELELDQHNVKNLSFHGNLEDWQKVLLESMASLMVGRPLSRLDQLSVRECEAWLRDRNSEMALESVPESAEKIFKNLFTWIRLSPSPGSGKEYTFPSEKGPFRNLKLTDKVRELKDFLSGNEVLNLYQGVPRPELVDVEGLTIYVEVHYETDREKALFEELHMIGVAAFQEENLNFIPEG